jgi:hypothetical protein
MIIISKVLQVWLFKCEDGSWVLIINWPWTNVIALIQRACDLEIVLVLLSSLTCVWSNLLWTRFSSQCSKVSVYGLNQNSNSCTRFFTLSSTSGILVASVLTFPGHPAMKPRPVVWVPKTTLALPMFASRVFLPAMRMPSEHILHWWSIL